MNVSITSKQEKQYKRFIEDAADKALEETSLDRDAIQRLFGNGGKFQADIVASIRKYSVLDERFVLINSFDLVVPEGYDHATRLDVFSKEHRKEFYCYNNAIIDENFAKATTKLVPGRKFKIKVFQIKQHVSSENCIGFLKSQKAILTGAQGASLAYELAKNQLPVSRWSLSFDEKEALWGDSNNYHRVPYVLRYSDGDYDFNLGDFEPGWSDGYCLLCFCDYE